MRVKILFLFLVLAFLAFGAAQVFAGTQSTTVTVQANVPATCTITTPGGGNINFGSYNPLSASPLTSNGQVSVTCTNTTSYGVRASSANGGVAGGVMAASTGPNLNYNLYTTSGGPTSYFAAGGTVGSDPLSTGVGTGSAQTVTLYGLIPIGQNVTPGASFNDVVTVNVDY